jgi:serine/threonine protein kinase
MAEGIQTGAVALPSGTQVDRYVADQMIERSDPFTLTYTARDVESGDMVQLVELFPAEFVTREGSEVRARNDDLRRALNWGLRGFADQSAGMQRLEHPNIACVLRAFEANGTGYYAIAPTDGEPLSAVMSRNKGGLTADLLVPLVNALVDALEQIHSAGLMHWDVRPDTILVNDKNQPLLIDFGAARHVMRFKCRSLATAVPAGYAAPEAYLPTGQFGPWTDIYSLAAVAYHAVSRSVPPDAQARVRGEAILRPAVKAGLGRYPEAFLEAIDWALRLDAAQRPQKLADWREALAGRAKPPEAVGEPEFSETTRPVEKRTIAAAVVAAEQAATVASTTPAPKRNMMPMLIGGGVVVAAIIAGVVFTRGEKPATESAGNTEQSAPADQGGSANVASTTPSSAPSNAQQQSVALDRLANELMAKQAVADAAVNAARDQAAKAASAASAANANANTDKAEKERLAKAAADAQAKEEAAKVEAARVKAELDQRLKDAEAEQRKKDEAALAAQQQAQQQAAQAAAATAAQQAAAPPAKQQQAAAATPAPAPAQTPPPAAPPPAVAAAPAPAPQQTQTATAAPSSSAPANGSPGRSGIFPPFNASTPQQQPKSDAQVAADAASANVVAMARKNCHTAAADVAATGDLTYDKAKLMPGARINSDTGTVTLRSVRMPDGRYAAVEIDKDSCAQVRGIRASP